MAATDPFLSERYDSLHDAPMQRRFRKLCPLPIGVEFSEWPGMSDEDLRGHFRLMKQFGFSCLTQIDCRPGSDPAKIRHLALDEGIIPWWYGEAGWEEISDDLLARLGIPLDSPMEAIRADERMIRYQTAMLHAYIDRRDPAPDIAGALDEAGPPRVASDLVDQDGGLGIARGAYLHASLGQDLGKGGWAFWNGAAQSFAGADSGPGAVTQLMLGGLAGGSKGIALGWWNPRPDSGGDGGSLLDRNQRSTARAERAGAIAQAARRHADELWQARKEPMVGVFVDDAALRRLTRSDGARVGVSRALINANVPFEYVTIGDLAGGLAGRYRALYLPGAIAGDRELLSLLRDYVERGGRLVIDLPGLCRDRSDRPLPTGPGSDFAALFGCTLDDLLAPVAAPRAIGGRRLTGLVADLTPLAAEIRRVYDDGRPAITEHHLGEGQAVILGCEAALACGKPGDAAGESLLIAHALGAHQPPYRCADAIVYRLSAPAADHYFLINDGPARTVVLDTGVYKYSSAIDAVSGEKIALGAPVALAAHSGRWLRCKRRGGGNRQPTWVIVGE